MLALLAFCCCSGFCFVLTLRQLGHSPLPPGVLGCHGALVCSRLWLPSRFDSVDAYDVSYFQNSSMAVVPLSFFLGEGADVHRRVLLRVFPLPSGKRSIVGGRVFAVTVLLALSTR